MNIVQYSVNIAMESTILLMLVVLFFTCVLQKTYFPTTKAFLFLQLSVIAILIVQIVTWSLLILEVPVKYGAMPMRIVYILDFILYYYLSVIFYYYVEALVIEAHEKIGTEYVPQQKVKKFIIIWGVLSTLFYGIMLCDPAIYHLENGVAVYSILGYIIMHILVKVAAFCALILIIKNRKILNKQEVILSSIFISLTAILIIVDETMDLCISYVVISLFVFILYVRIDIHRGILLERKEREITEWKTQIMLSQMQPHFIYNVLTTISSMCEMQNAMQARDVVNHFADYFRTNLESLEKERKISFAKELEHVKTYLWLEKIRFEDLINIQYEIETTNFEIPSLVIQPMAENAVKHGIHPKEDGGTVVIKAYETEENYVVVVEDDGVGFDVNAKPNDNRVHIGIENVRKRLELVSNGTLEIKSEIGKGTNVTIRIPKGE